MKLQPIIGVCGYMGSGKSTLVQIWKEHFGITILDADRIARELMMNNIDIISNVEKEFNTVSEGKIDFVALGKVVFADGDKLNKLNAIVHPLLINHISFLAEESLQPVLLDCALLTLWGDQIKTDCSIWVDVTISKRIARLQKRMGLPYEECEIRCIRQEQLFSPPGYAQNWVVISNEENLETAIKLGCEIIQPFLER